jgi:hypothetical protein
MAGSVEADPRLIEEAVRDVPGVAFAEVHAAEGEGLLALVLWQGTDPAECAYRIETVLRDRFEIELRPSDLRVVGYASPRVEPPSTELPVQPPPEPPLVGGPPPPELRVIELDGSGTTWATEPVPPMDAPLPPPAQEPTPAEPPAPEPAAPRETRSVDPALAPLEERAILASLTVERVIISEGATDVHVRVELRAGDRVHTGEASGPATASRKQRSLCHATLRAVASALPGVRFDLDHATVVELPEPAVIVVVTRLDAAGERRLTGAALAGRDTATAFVRATLAAVR